MLDLISGVLAQECVTGPGEVFYFPESWHHATLNVADTIGIAFNHVPPPDESSRLVTPRDYHWRIYPLDRLHESDEEKNTKIVRQESSAADLVYGNPYVEVQNAISRAAEYGPDTDCNLHDFDRTTTSSRGSNLTEWVLGSFVNDDAMPNNDGFDAGQDDINPTQKADHLSAECIDAVVDLAVIEVADYAWCGQNTVGVAQPSAVSQVFINAAAKGVLRLKNVVVGDMKAETSNVAAQSRLYAAPRSYMGPKSQVAWARASFVLGMTLLTSGDHQDQVMGTTCVLAGLKAGCRIVLSLPVARASQTHK